MEDTSGFYKLYDDVLMHGVNFVYNKDYTLLRENKDSLILPIDGWYWFDSIEEAKVFFGIGETK